MYTEIVINAIQQYGYIALFFSLWLGIIGMPIPDEVIVMSGGLVTTLGILHPVPAFLITYAGVITGLSIGYVLGRVLGTPSLKYLSQKKNMGQHISKATRLVEHFGSYSLVASYFIPIVRHVVPYIGGITKMPFLRYAWLSYTTGFIWTLFYFVIGRYFGNNIQNIASFLEANKFIIITLFLLGGALFMAKESAVERK